MRRHTKIGLLPGAMLAMLLGACATPGTGADDGAPSPDAHLAVIDTVVDLRPFLAGTADPGLPSLAAGNGPDADAGYRKTVVARLVAGPDRAGHDLPLPDGGDVESKTRDLVARSLRESGYTVLADGAPVPDAALHVKAGVREFWAWVTPGHGAEAREAKLLIEIIATGPKGRRQFVVPAYGASQGAPGQEGDWRFVFAQAFKDYLLKQRLAFAQNAL